MRRKRFIYALVAVVAFGSLSAVQADNASTTKIYMDANTDFMNNHTIPMIAKVDQKIEIKLVNGSEKLIEENSLDVTESEIAADAVDGRKKPNDDEDKDDNSNKYKISVIGENGKIAEFTKAKKSTTYSWTPELGQAGIFTVVVTTANINEGQSPRSNQILSQRKIYVDDKTRSDGTNYYQISDFSINTLFERGGKTYSLEEARQMTTSSMLSIESSREATTSGALSIRSASETELSTMGLFDPRAVVYMELGQATEWTVPQFKIEVGEEMIWKKTVKDYKILPVGGFVEGVNFAKFDRGTYTLWGSVKAKDSIEPEDEKKIYYTRKKANAPVIKSLNSDGKYLNVTLEESKDQFVYAFIKHDDLGATLLKDYSTDSSCVLPSDDYDYKIEVRVKHLENSGRWLDNDQLPNSYETHKFYEVAGTKQKLQLSNVTITQSSVGRYYSAGNGILDDGDQAVYVNDKNYIHFTATNVADESSVYYKAWVIDDGVYIPLESFKNEEGETYFVYYPKSGGNGHSVDSEETHKLVVSAESTDGRTGSKTINLTVDDIE